jgi:uncharacterized protein (DUF1697 family)
MPVLISMLRGVNLGPRNRIKMDTLRALYESMKLEGARTYVQSGNVIFRTKEKNSPKLVAKIQDAIEKNLKFRPEVILRTTDELRQAIAATFLAAEPPAEACAALARLATLKSYPEELHVIGRELYIYFPSGAGRSKLPWSSVEKLLKVTGTARNWNSVLAMLQIAEEMEASAATR